ncbi:hypothetical protein [Aquimarina pacifica]|uniref:hypothetical protein n=1 Tax=Aquimarina pacifica TaxID=1296415 RepID=UPI000471D3CD|nr:hypothetical protein [Aquimarina pacifica]
MLFTSLITHSYADYENKLIELTTQQLESYNIDKPLRVDFQEEYESIVYSQTPVMITPEYKYAQDSSSGYHLNFETELFALDTYTAANGEKYVVAVGDQQALVIADPVQRDALVYEFTDDRYFYDIVAFGNSFIICGGGELYVLNDFDTLGFTKYNYNNFNDNFFDNGIYVFGESIYVISENTLYRSNNQGASFTIVNDNLPFSQSNSDHQLIYANGSLIVIDQGSVYMSADDGTSFALSPNSYGTTYTHISNKTDNDYFLFFGDNGYYGEGKFDFPVSIYDEDSGQNSASSASDFIGNEYSGDYNYRVYYENEIYVYNVIDHTLELVGSANLNLKDVTSIGNFYSNDDIWGISNDYTIRWDLYDFTY